jgi:hypothetical protein
VETQNDWFAEIFETAEAPKLYTLRVEWHPADPEKEQREGTDYIGLITRTLIADSYATAQEAFAAGQEALGHYLSSESQRVAGFHAPGSRYRIIVEATVAQERTDK